MRDMVFESLDNAYFENHYEEMIEWSALRVAEDLNMCCYYFEDIEPERIVPFVEEWQNAVKNGNRNPNRT